jgi:lysophospholipase L1-like esterase
LLAFGDSMTEGTTSPALPLTLTAGIPQSYPFKLQALVTARYTNQTIVVLNAGFAGRHAVDDRDRFNLSLSDARPELLLLMHGANDLQDLAGLSGPALTNGITRTVDAVEDLVRDAAGRGIRVMLMTLPPENASRPKGGAATFVGRYNDALKVMGAKKGALVIDVNALLPLSFVGQDGLHLTEAGNARLAEITRDAVAEAFDRKP